jgi:hypothetical protein
VKSFCRHGTKDQEAIVADAPIGHSICFRRALNTAQGCRRGGAGRQARRKLRTPWSSTTKDRVVVTPSELSTYCPYGRFVSTILSEDKMTASSESHHGGRQTATFAVSGPRQQGGAALFHVQGTLTDFLGKRLRSKQHRSVDQKRCCKGGGAHGHPRFDRRCRRPVGRSTGSLLAPITATP